jgi:hypothetical protein
MVSYNRLLLANIAVSWKAAGVGGVVGARGRGGRGDRGEGGGLGGLGGQQLSALHFIS